MRLSQVSVCDHCGDIIGCVIEELEGQEQPVNFTCLSCSRKTDGSCILRKIKGMRPGLLEDYLKRNEVKVIVINCCDRCKKGSRGEQKVAQRRWAKSA